MVLTNVTSTNIVPAYSPTGSYYAEAPAPAPDPADSNCHEYLPDAENAKPNTIPRNDGLANMLASQADFYRMQGERQMSIARATEAVGRLASKDPEQRTPLEQTFLDKFTHYQPAFVASEQFKGVWEPSTVEVANLLKKSLKAVADNNPKEFPHWGPPAKFSWFDPQRTEEEDRAYKLALEQKQLRAQKMAYAIAMRHNREGAPRKIIAKPVPKNRIGAAGNLAAPSRCTTPPPSGSVNREIVHKPSPVRATAAQPPKQRGLNVVNGVIKNRVAEQDTEARVLFGDDEPRGNE